jgi:hypothetical protein
MKNISKTNAMKFRIGVTRTPHAQSPNASPTAEPTMYPRPLRFFKKNMYFQPRARSARAALITTLLFNCCSCCSWIIAHAQDVAVAWMLCMPLMLKVLKSVSFFLGGKKCQKVVNIGVMRKDQAAHPRLFGVGGTILRGLAQPLNAYGYKYF